MKKTIFIRVAVVALIAVALLAGAWRMRHRIFSIKPSAVTAPQTQCASISLPEVEFGEGPVASALTLSINAKGQVFYNGAASSLKEIKDKIGRPDGEGPYTINLDPTLLEVDSTLQISDVLPLLTILTSATRFNIIFLVKTPAGIEALSLPMLRSDECARLRYSYGANVHEDNTKQDHVWVDGWIGPLGNLCVQGIGVSNTPQYMITVADAEEQERLRTELYSLDESVPHPPKGIWSMTELGKFIHAPRSNGRTAFVRLSVFQNDKMVDVLTCLSAIKKTVGDRVIPIIYLIKKPMPSSGKHARRSENIKKKPEWDAPWNIPEQPSLPWKAHRPSKAPDPSASDVPNRPAVPPKTP